MAVNIAIQEVGGNVVWTATGTLNLAGLTYFTTQPGGGDGFDGNARLFASGLATPNTDVYNGSITLPSAFGGGGGASSASGSYIGIYGTPSLYVPAGYVSGAALSGVTTYNSATFASLGLTVGTYVYSWGSGGNADTLTLSIGAQPTPTPTITQTQTSTPTPTATLPPAPSTVEITSNNYSGQTADITFYPCSGGTISLGSQVIPYSYQTTYYYGQYSLYFSAYNSTCTYDIVCPSPTPTTTQTPTYTPTTTPTPTSAATPSFAVSFTQSGPDVVLSYSGALDLTGLVYVQDTTSGSGGVGVTSASFGIGPTGSINISLYTGATFSHPANFGPGGGGPGGAASGTGSYFGVFTGVLPVYSLVVPTGYVSGTNISGTTTLPSSSFASLGMTIGTYNYSWGAGPGQSFDVTIQ